MTSTTCRSVPPTRTEAGPLVRLLATVVGPLCALVACESAHKPDQSTTWAHEMARCGMAAEMKVVAATGAGGACSGAQPVTGSPVRLIKDGKGLALGWGDVRLESQSSGDCVFKFAGCQAVVGKWVGLSAVLEAGPGGPRLTMQGRGVQGHQQLDCPANAVYQLASAATPTGGPGGGVGGTCNFVGTWKVSKAPTLASGTCDLSWSPGDVEIHSDSGKLLLEWPGSSEPFVLTVNTSACTATAVPESDMLIFNGAVRTESMTLQLANGQLAGTIADQLEGESDFGEKCKATFAFTSDLPGAAATPTGKVSNAIKLAGTFGPACGEAPYVCGDQVCDGTRGEGCHSCPADCACALDQNCLGDVAVPGICRTKCTFGGKACGAGLVCDRPLSEEKAPAGATYCYAVGTVKEAAGCQRQSDCAEGLQCWIDKNPAVDWALDRGVCAKPCAGCDHSCRKNQETGALICPVKCTLGTPGQCGKGAMCYDKYANYEFYPGVEDLAPVCMAEAPAPVGLGSACKLWDAPCGDALMCLNLTSGKSFCTKPCTDNAGCGDLICVKYSSGTSYCSLNEK